MGFSSMRQIKRTPFSVGPRGPLGLLVSGVLVAGGGGLARAQDDAPSVGDVNRIAGELDQEIARMKGDLELVARAYGAPLAGEVGRVDRRLREGEIHFLLNDYLRASIVLLDVVEDEGNAGHPRYDDCVFLLAESLRKQANFSGAKRYHEQLFGRAQGERLKDVVLGLLHIASETSRYEDVDRYVARLREAGTMSRPDVDYIYGKMLFRSAGGDASKLLRTHDVFRGIPEGSAVSTQASYYAGVALVKMGRYEEAMAQFDETVRRAGTSREGAELRELAFLSKGRLYQELGQVDRAVDAYQEVSRTSAHFGETLFELAWAHVTAAGAAIDAEEQKKSLTRALRALELLMATSPGSRLEPEARLLQGNLEIRLGAPETAYDTFQGIVDRYGGAKGKVDRVVSTRDPRAFFDQLVAPDLSRVAPEDMLPPVALAWAAEEDEMRRAINMQQDLSDTGRFLEESRDLIETLGAALEGEQRFNMFPGLKTARSKAISVENRLLNGTRRLLTLERRMVLPSVGAAARAQIDAAHERARQVEEAIQRLPQSEEQVESTRGEIREAYLATGRRAHQLGYRISSMRAQVVAVEAWLRDNRDSLSGEQQALVEQRLVAAREEVAGLERESARLQSDIRKATELVSGDAGRARARALASQFNAAVAEELALLQAERRQVKPELQGLLARLDQQRAALGGIDDEIRQLQVALEEHVRQEVDDLRRQLALEVNRIEKLKLEHAQLQGETDTELGPVARRSLNAVGRELERLVLEADVGIIDVAWNRKQAETERVNVLIREQQQRALELEAEFADVLRE